METDVENECTGEILYATSYGLNIGRTLYHTSLNKVTDAWIESVKVQKRVVCENTAWADFELTTDIVLEHNDKPEIVAMRRFCYKSFCQNISSFFGITNIYQFLNKIFKRNYVLNSTDIIYKMFIDSMLYDVRFIVCVRLPRIAINLNKEYLDETENQTIDNSNKRSVVLSTDDILTNLANDNLNSKLKSNNKLYVDNESIYSASDDGILSRYENEMNNISRPNNLVKNISDRNIKNSYVNFGDSYSDIFDSYNDFSESEEGSLNNEFVKGNVDSDRNVINKLSINPNNDRSVRNDLYNIQADTGPTSLSATTATTTNVTTTTTTNNNNNSNTTTKTTDLASTVTTATVSENFSNGVVSKTSVVTTDVAKNENEKIEKEKTKSYYSLSFLNDEDDRESNVVITEQVEEENQSGQVGPSVNVIPPSSRINEKVVTQRNIVEESENTENGDNFQYDDGEQITYEIDGPWLNKRRKKSSKIQIDEIENNVEIQKNLLNDYDDDSNVEIEELKVEEPAPSSSSLPQQSQPQQQQEQFNNSNVEIEQIVQDGGVEQLTAADGGDGSDDIYSKPEELLKESVSRGGDGSVRMDIDEELKLDQFLIKSQNRKRRIREGECEENIDAENLPNSAKYRLVAAKEKPKRLKNKFVKRRLIKSNNSGNRNMHDDDKENVNIIFARPVEEEMQLAKPLEDYNNDIREDEDNIIISEEIMESKQIHPTTPNMSTPPISLIKSRKRRIVREQNEEEYEPFLPPAKIRKVDDYYVRRRSQHEPPPPTLLSDNNVVDSYNEEEEYYANLASGRVNVQRQSLSSANRNRVETFSTPTSEMDFEIQNTTSGSKKSKQKNIIKLPELLFVGLDDKRCTSTVKSEQIMTNLYEEKMSYVLFKGIIINKSMDDTDLHTLARNNIVLFYTVNRKLDGSAVMKLFKIVNNTINNDDNYYLELHENIIDDIIHKLFGQRSDKSNFNIRRFTVDKANLNITMDNVLHLLFKRLDVSTTTTPKRGSIRV